MAIRDDRIWILTTGDAGEERIAVLQLQRAGR
jgi:hypothetical protein